MKQAKHSYVVIAALALAGFVGMQTAQAGVITAPDIADGASTYTTGDGLVTLTPYAIVSNLVVGTFGVGGDYFGVGAGGAINDADGDPNTTDDREAIDIALDATVGFSQIGFIWTRADGPLPTDGIEISGFLSDPGASSGTYSNGTVYIQQGWTGGTIFTYDFANLAASAGETLRVSGNDSDEAGLQVVVNSISYAAIPEPATLGLIGLASVGMLMFRRFLF